MKFRFVAAILTGLVLIAGACSQSASEMSDAELREALTSVLTDDTTFDENDANCVVDYLFANTERDQLNRMADAQTESELDPGDIDVLTNAVFDCLA